jgi:hypothetical protein
LQNKIASHHARVRQEKEALDAEHPSGFMHITSVENWAKGSTPGSVAEANTLIAATAIVNGTARPSTESEIADFHRRQETGAVLLNSQVQLRREPPPIPGITLVRAQ